MREGEGSSGHADIQCLGTIWRDFPACVKTCTCYKCNICQYTPSKVVYNNPLLPIFGTFPCVHHSINCSTRLMNKGIPIKVHHRKISRFFRTYLKSRVSSHVLNFSCQLWIGHRVILDRWKLENVWSVQQIMGQTPYQHFRRIFSKSFGFSVRETGQSNLWKSSQQIIYINLL